MLAVRGSRRGSAQFPTLYHLQVEVSMIFEFDLYNSIDI